MKKKERKRKGKEKQRKGRKGKRETRKKQRKERKDGKNKKTKTKERKPKEKQNLRPPRYSHPLIHLLLQPLTHFLLPWLDVGPLFLARSFLILNKCIPPHNKYPNTCQSHKANFVELCWFSSFSYSHSCFQQ